MVDVEGSVAEGVMTTGIVGAAGGMEGSAEGVATG